MFMLKLLYFSSEVFPKGGRPEVLYIFYRFHQTFNKTCFPLYEWIPFKVEFRRPSDTAPGDGGESLTTIVVESENVFLVHNLWITGLLSRFNDVLQCCGSSVYCPISGREILPEEQLTRVFTTAAHGCMAIREWGLLLGMEPGHLGHCNHCACHHHHLLPIS